VGNDEIINPDDIIEFPIDGILDLHTFSPKEIKELVPAYLEECIKRGIKEVQIIHGKGKGVLRQIVHSILAKHPEVILYKQDSSWDSTLVILQVSEDSSC